MQFDEDKLKSLEHQYSPSKWIIRSIPGGQDPVLRFLKIGSEVNEKLIRQFTCDLNIVYGDGEKAKLDIYYPPDWKNQTKDVLIFIHGGYWQAGSKDNYPFLGQQLHDLNCIFVALGYDLAPEASMDGMVAQIQSAIVFTGRRFPSSRLFLVGHSAGAHLSAMMMTMNWEDSGLSPQRFTGVCLLSGVYDLEPLLPTYINEPIKMNKEIAVRNSPMKVVQSRGLTIQCKVLIVVAEHDSPAFHHQKNFSNLLKETMVHPSVEHLELPGVDHFDMLEKCAERNFILNQVLANFMKSDIKCTL
ncbi:kynurenine formamidase-like [Dendronephthya gigantea]|uniref:kynurenine formamidase-like n=1 Tax=Dendronephthya gigantea TaxID=151771 RepID=UPI00106D35E5|nr:kynurenine formamidase-like [Dendronephthya gigantea]